MGDLLANNQLSLKDLGFAIENTYANERVQRAAIALLLERLKQKTQEPTPSVGFLKVISGGKSYSEKRQFLMHIGLSFFSGVFIALYFTFTIWAIQKSFYRQVCAIFVRPHCCTCWHIILIYFARLLGVISIFGKTHYR